MKTIFENKFLSFVVIVIIIGGVWWFIDYSKDKSFCEDKTKFAGTSQDGYYYNDWMDNWKETYTTRYESREIAIEACIKYKRR